ncbi:MAG: nitroreductase family protein [Bacteroidota bacterium]
MDVFEAIKSRRSVYPNQYNDKEISKSAIEKILATANWAPNHRKTEPWRFKVLQGKAKSNLADFLVEKQTSKEGELSSFKERKIRSKFEDSSAVIAICMQRDLNERLPEWEEIAAVAMAVQNMWLACTAENIGSYWSSPALISELADFFDFAQGEYCLGFFYMGYFDENLPIGERKSSVEEKVTWLK